jgi:Recombinase zinc beta ribbon domain
MARTRACLTAEAAPARRPGDAAPAHWEKRRPRHLLSGKVFCGSCGRGLSVAGQDYLGCKAAKHGTCGNTTTIRRADLAAHVMDALGRQLMRSELVAAFIAAFNAEWQHLAAKVTAQANARERDLAANERKISNLVDAVADGKANPSILAKLQALEAQQETLRAQPRAAPDLPPALHPGIAQIYAFWLPPAAACQGWAHVLRWFRDRGDGWVQVEADCACQKMQFFVRWLAIDRVAQDRATEFRAMHAHLVRASGARPKLQPGYLSVVAEHAPIRHRRLAFCADDDAPARFCAASQEGRVHRAGFCRRSAAHHRPVDFFGAAGGELGLGCAECGFSERDDEAAGGVRVQPVGQPGSVLAARQQREKIFYAGAAARAGVHG